MKWAQYHLRAQYGIVNAFHEGTNLTLTATFMAKVFFLLYNKETKANKGLSHLPKVTTCVEARACVLSRYYTLYAH